MAVVDQFLSRYQREIDYYEHAARLVAGELETRVNGAGIRAMITYRAKDPDRLKEKVNERNQEKNYQTVEDIFEDIVDLAGTRIALYFPGDREKVDKLVRERFVLVQDPKIFPNSSRPPTYEKRFSGYWATHYRVHLKPGTLQENQRRFANALVEIQVASVLMHAWAEVEHDLVYKPMQGNLSKDEYAILDELNGLVLSGEIALERLQEAMRRRLSQSRSSFSNHYDLTSFLLKEAGQTLDKNISDSALGRVDTLYSLLTKLDLAKPSYLRGLLKRLHDDLEERAVAEQLVDLVLAEDADRYDIFAKVRDEREHRRTYWGLEGSDFSLELQAAVGKFMTQWIQLEGLFRNLVPPKNTKQRGGVLPTSRVLAQLDILNTDQREELSQLRYLRNNLVHGIEIPSIEQLKDAAGRITKLVKYLKKKINTD